MRECEQLGARTAPAGRSVALLAALGTLVGCGGIGGGYPITRTVGGHARAGVYIPPESYEHFIRGELAVASGDLRAAAREYEAARSGSAGDPYLVARLADVRDRLGQEQQALSLLDEAEARDHESEPVLLARGAIAERHERWDDAESAYERASAGAPESDAPVLALAELLRRRARAEEADADLERYAVHARGPGAARARLALAIESGDPHAAMEAVRALLEVAPARADEVREAARVALAHDRPEIAARLLAALPDDETNRELRLDALIAARRYDDAATLLGGWMPEGPEELLRVADGYLAIGDPARARDLAEVAARGEGGPRAQLAIGRALAAMGDRGRAATVLSAIGPGTGAWPDAPIALADVLRDAGLPARAAEVLARARTRGDDPRLARALASAREADGDVEGALQALAGEAFAVDRAGALDRAGRFADSARLWVTIDPEPDDPEPGDPEPDGLDARARARARAERAAAAGQRDEAVRVMRAWVERAPEDAAARARLEQLLGREPPPS
ncbi:MAG: hypothetical protein AB7P00_26350 [Sandaracinaceae bacterium]